MDTTQHSEHLEESCRYCGCTEHDACPGGCSWIAPGICSTCEKVHGFVGAIVGGLEQLQGQQLIATLNVFATLFVRTLRMPDEAIWQGLREQADRFAAAERALVVEPPAPRIILP